MATTKPIPGQRDIDIQAPEMVQKYWDKFFQAHPADFERHGKQAMDWFRVQVSKATHQKAEKIIQAPNEYQHTNPKASRQMIGKLYLYKYEAEEAGDEETGLYDKYPMVFFFNATKTKEGKSVLWGLNMHYLLPKERGILYRELMKLKVSKRWTPKTKLRLQWDLIKAASSSGLFEKAVHAYRVDRIKSRMVEIPANDWIVAVFLRLERFVKAKSHETGPSPTSNRKAVQHKNKLKKKSISKK